MLLGASLLLLPRLAWAQQNAGDSPPSPASSSTAPTEGSSGNFAAAGAGEVGRVFAACKGAIVRIIASDRFGRHAGTGFFIDPHGSIYTHSSVGGQACWDLTVEFRGQRYPAICLLSDPRSGLALLKIEVANTPFLPIGKSDNLEIASPVLVIGYPADLPASPSSGIVAGIDQQVLGEFLSPAHIRADLLVQPGEQGAPLLNLRGEAVGIISGRLSGGGTSAYALPIKAAEKLRRDFARFGEPRPGWVGATISPPPELVNDDHTEVRLDQLAPDGPAIRAGLRPNDVLLRVGDTPIHRPSDIYEASFYLTGGDPVQVEVSRDGEEKTFNVVATDHPASRRGQEERRRLEEEGDPGLRLPGGSKLSLDHGR
ncbi:MAG: serine protease [Verrucomicrobia bacterium]|nr:serine protease [Verrucomicrobiota bacterium]